MKCKEVQDRLSPYLDKELEQGQLKRIGDHLNQCSTCLKQLDLWKKTDACLKGIPREELTKGFHRKLLQEVEALSMPIGGVTYGRRPIWSPGSTIHHIFALFRRSKGPWTMDAFDDFPPWSLGHVYLKLIKENQ